MRLATLFSATVGILLIISTGAHASNDWSALPKKKQTKLGLYMTPSQAYGHMQNQGDKALFLDIRSRAEVNFLGSPAIIDANIPYMELNEWYAWNEKKNDFKMEVNSDFVDFLTRRLKEKGLNKNDPIILICRSGTRSSKAADLLADLGFKKVYSIAEGFEGDKAKTGAKKGQRVINGWKNSNLPWSYKLVKAKMYKIGD